MVSKINDKYPELSNYEDEHGQTPVHYAAGIDNNTLRVLLQGQSSSSSAAYIRDKEGRTSAHIAAQQNNIDGLKLLMDHFPDSCEIEDNQGRNIVHYAAFLGRVEALDYFLRDSRFSDIVNKRDHDGNTPLHLYASSLTDLPIASLRRIRRLIPKLMRPQLKTYNEKKLTPGDIANDYKILELEPDCQAVVNDFRGMAPKGGRVKHWLQPIQDFKDDVEAQRNDLSFYKKRKNDLATKDLLKTANSHMVVAALIATISFAAGLAVPGGFNQDTRDKMKGGAILSNNPDFQEFLFFDCIAFGCSLAAILSYFLIAVQKGKGSSKYLFLGAYFASAISIIASFCAFTQGTYSIIVSYNRNFASVPKRTLLVVIYVYSLSVSVFWALGILFTLRNRLREKDPQKMKRKVLHGQVETQNRTRVYLP